VGDGSLADLAASRLDLLGNPGGRKRAVRIQDLGDGRAFSLLMGFSFGARGVLVFRAGAGSSAMSSRSTILRSVSFASSSAIFARTRSSEVGIIGFPDYCRMSLRAHPKVRWRVKGKRLEEIWICGVPDEASAFPVASR
jgi:hypothetical protein